MKQSGRTSLVTLVTGALVLVVIVLLSFGKESLSSVGSRFMTALSKGDVDTLTKMSYLGKEPEEQIKKEWDFAVNTAGKHYRFFWHITGDMQPDENSGAVHVMVTRNIDTPGAYEESYQLPLQKVDGQWKVDVAGISREMFPALPH